MISEEIRTRKIYPDGISEDSTSLCICEHRLTVRINGRPLYDIVCTGDDIEELVTGRLYTDGFGRDIHPVISEDRHTADVTTADDITDRETIICDTVNAPYPQRKLRMLKKDIPDAKTVFEMISLFSRDGDLHRKTGGTHRCIIYDTATDKYAAYEDISRHNAVDKAVGHALTAGFDLSDCILFTSGRVPVDMAEKVIAAGIPVLISKSVPTADSVKLAGEYGLTLICRAWKDSFEIFS